MKSGDVQSESYYTDIIAGIISTLPPNVGLGLQPLPAADSYGVGGAGCCTAIRHAVHPWLAALAPEQGRSRKMMPI